MHPAKTWFCTMPSPSFCLSCHRQVVSLTFECAHWQSVHTRRHICFLAYNGSYFQAREMGNLLLSKIESAMSPDQIHKIFVILMSRQIHLYCLTLSCQCITRMEVVPNNTETGISHIKLELALLSKGNIWKQNTSFLTLTMGRHR